MSQPEITVRDPSFDHGAVPRYWHAGGRAVTIYYDSLSLLLPAGERFVVAAVKAHRDAARTDEQRAELRAFCAQEGVHSREHAAYNRAVAGRGYPAAALERRVDELARAGKRLLSPRARLALMCGFEHLTALMANALLGDPRSFDGAHPAMAALWRWHAVEEIEHKAVAFDLHRAAGGPWSERAWTLLLATAVLGAKLVEQQVVMMRADRCLGSPREWGRLLAHLYVRPGILRKIIPDYLAYLRPGFHPSDLPNDAAFETWRAALAA